MSENNIEIGRRIKQRREELGMTQDELGKILSLNKSTIQRYETGKITKIKLPVLQSIANALDVSPDWLALKTDTPAKPAEQARPQISDEDIAFALFQGSEGVTEEMYEEVKRYAEMVKLRENSKKE
jgi:transcriptional regulator with XRE-family HTH domain